ncbi:MAG TPA: GH116 family glycosyl hydrolase [Terriglobia bacterium]|nr:GH116 family glycosyl hydrolase [Terriglobia bacterium]
MSAKLFPTELPELQWAEFSAEGFAAPVPGIVYRAGQSSCGIPLGGVGTGCLDLDTDATFGRCSIFNSFVPHRVLAAPFLALGAGAQTWALTARAMPGLAVPQQIYYWGHYPIADLEFDLGGPLSAGLRAWCPFLPGDAEASNTPAAVFELRLRNESGGIVRGSVAFTFPGPTEEESGARQYQHTRLDGSAPGVCVTSPQGAGYALAVAGVREARAGGVLDAAGWLAFANELPIPGSGPGSTLAVDFELQPHEERSIPVILAWYMPRWAGSPAHHYLHAYQKRFRNPGEVVEFIAGKRREFLERIIHWQEEVYGAKEYPLWLRDQLVNVLHTIPEDSFWAGESVPAEEWYGPDGIFGMTESPRTTPHICNPSDWYGGLPIVFFFPKLAAALLRAYVHFQLPNGEIPLGIGEGGDLAHPNYHLLHTMNSMVHIHLIDRLWQRDLDRSVLEEFYPSAKKALEYAQSLDRNSDGLLDLEPDPVPNQFYGAWFWYGTATHVNGLWLAAVAMLERMATAMGDAETATACRVRRHQGSQSLEEKLWGDGSYVLYTDLAGRRSDTVLANQLAGDWCGHLHGLPAVFPPDRAERALATVKQLCLPLTHAGVLNAARADGGVDTSGSPQSNGIFAGECMCVAATLAYNEDAATALDIARRLQEAMILQERREWDMPNLLDAAGRVQHGTDFYQNMILWGLPLALVNLDIRRSCSPGALIQRILAAAQRV